MSFKAVIFDLDGTLCNTMPDLITSMNEMLRNAGLPERTDEQLIAAINCGAYEFVRRSLPEEYYNDEEFTRARLKEYNSTYEKHYLDKTHIYDGVLDAVKELKASGVKLGVLSNKPDKHCKNIIYTLFGEKLFDIVMGQGAFPTKPDPSAAIHIAKEFGILPSLFAFVGDSNVDMQTAINAGMHPVGVSWGYRSIEILKESGAEKIITETGLIPENIL